MDRTRVFCPNLTCPARGQTNQGNIWIHSQKEHRYRCTVCGKTFAARTGTALYRLHKPEDLMTRVITLLAHGCPVAAIVVAFTLDERTVAAWQYRAGQHCERGHQALVEQPHDLGQVQADEMRIKKQGGIVWVAMALMVPTRLWLGAVTRVQRDGALAQAMMQIVRRCAGTRHLLIAVDGWAPYLTAIRHVFRDSQRTGIRGRPHLRLWTTLAVAQIVKQHARRHLVGILRRIVIGTESVAFLLRCATQYATMDPVYNTAWIERLNGTFRSRLVVLVRRGRCLARKIETIHAAICLVGTVYNFCAPHTTLSREAAHPCTPAMAAAITDHPWSVRDLLAHPVPIARWVPPCHRGRRSRSEQALIDRWAT
jgi:transposase-like protein/IS1 family transposase